MSAQTAKEPSMEDILASIRKIISEDNQDDATGQGKPSPLATASSTGAGSPSVAAVGSPALTNTLIERREMHDGKETSATASAGESAPAVQSGPVANTTPVDWPHASAPIPGPVDHKPITADAQLGNEIKSYTQNTSSQMDSPLHPAIANAKAYVVSNIASDGVSEQMKSDETPVFENSNSIAMQASPTTLVSPDSIERRDEDERRNHPLRRGEDRDDDKFKNALMSPATDNAVMNAFEQLKNSATDNLDSKVEALLRPMLREWLDNNLPSMVERLVRDEIERVSRGD